MTDDHNYHSRFNMEFLIQTRVYCKERILSLKEAMKRPRPKSTRDKLRQQYLTYLILRLYCLTMLKSYDHSRLNDEMCIKKYRRRAECLFRSFTKKFIQQPIVLQKDKMKGIIINHNLNFKVKNALLPYFY